jgi:hypothetical protein
MPLQADTALLLFSVLFLVLSLVLLTQAAAGNLPRYRQ